MWGLSYLATKTALLDMGPFELAAARMSLAAVLFLPMFLRRRAALTRREQILLGLLGVTLYSVLFNLGLVEGRATDAGFIQASTPAVTALLAIPFLRERARPITWLGIGVSTAGVMALVLGTTARGTGSAKGDLFIVGSVLAWSIYSIYARRLSRRIEHVAITSTTLVVGTLLLVPPTFIELSVVTPRLTPPTIVAILYSGLMAVALGYLLWSYGLARVPAAVATVYLNLLPVIAAASGAIALGERLGTNEVVAGIVIITGVVLATLSERGGVGPHPTRARDVDLAYSRDVWGGNSS